MMDTTVRNKVILALVLTVATSGAYMISMQPKPEPGPLILTLNGEEFPDSMFEESYDYTNFDDVDVRFQLLINNEEFASEGTQHSEKTVYEFDDWDEAWTVIEGLEIPNIVIGLAKWLRNGTHLEAGERFYGSIEEYDRRKGGWRNREVSGREYSDVNLHLHCRKSADNISFLRGPRSK